MGSTSEYEETNFYDNLTSHLRGTSQSLNETLHLLRSSYQIEAQNAAFVKARHRLFSELKLYGDFIHPSAIDAVTNVKQTTETLSQASNLSEIGEILPFVLRDCERSLTILQTLPIKYGQVLENMEELKEDILVAMAVKTKKEKETPFVMARAQYNESMGDTGIQDFTIAASWNRLKRSASAAMKSVFPRSSSMAESLETENEPGTSLEVVKNGVDQATLSIRFMYDTLQILELFLQTILGAANSSREMGRNDFGLFLEKATDIAQGCSSLISTRNTQEQVLVSIEDSIEEIYQRHWMEKLVKGGSSHITQL